MYASESKTCSAGFVNPIEGIKAISAIENDKIFFMGIFYQKKWEREEFLSNAYLG